MILWRYSRGTCSDLMSQKPDLTECPNTFQCNSVIFNKRTRIRTHATSMMKEQQDDGNISISNADNYDDSSIGKRALQDEEKSNNKAYKDVNFSQYEVKEFRIPIPKVSTGNNEDEDDEDDDIAGNTLSLYAKKVTLHSQSTMLSKERVEIDVTDTTDVVGHEYDNEDGVMDDREEAIIIVIHGGPGLSDHTESYNGLIPILDYCQNENTTNTEQKKEQLRDNNKIRSTTGGTVHISSMYFFDQLGCGKSQISSSFDENTDDTKKWKNEYCNSNNDNGKEGKNENDENQESLLRYLCFSLSGHVYQLQAVIDHVIREEQLETAVNTPTITTAKKKKKICLLGHSWGGQLVLEWFFQRHQERQQKQRQDQTDASSDNVPIGDDGNDNNCVSTVIVSNAPLDEKSYMIHQQAIYDAIEDETLKQFLEMEEELMFSSNNDDDEYGASSRSSSHTTPLSTKIYQTLIGRSDRNITGTMASWSAMERLKSLVSKVDDDDDDDSAVFSAVAINGIDAMTVATKRTIQEGKEKVVIDGTTNVPIPNMLLIATKDDTIPYQDYLTIQKAWSSSSSSKTTTTTTKTNSSMVSTTTTTNENFDTQTMTMRIVILEEGGHGPFYFHSTRDAYFNHVVDSRLY